MTTPLRLTATALLFSALISAQNKSSPPRWYGKYQTLLQNGSGPAAPKSNSIKAGANVDVSNECGPQSETFIAINTMNSTSLAGGSNEIFRLPMRGYSSSDGGNSWAGVDLPLPPPIGANGIDFGSDPSLAFDTSGNLFYSYILVDLRHGHG